MLVVFVLDQPCKILSRNNTNNCRDCAYLLMYINEASPRTGNMLVVKRPARDACLCMGELQAPAAPPAPHFVFLITL